MCSSAAWRAGRVGGGGEGTYTEGCVNGVCLMYCSLRPWHGKMRYSEVRQGRVGRGLQKGAGAEVESAAAALNTHLALGSGT